ncbi:MAG: hypothetical protein IPP87_16420 [Ideonella sp.]|nr:hypothetical protein [Ideonella sp.]
MTDPTNAFARMVPGFDFLQGLVKNAGAAMPSVGQWVAPTLNPEEIEKRIDELKTVQFWLEQNARMLGATIQALEVQRMTLSTLKTMNVSFSDLTESLKIRMPEPAAAPAPQVDEEDEEDDDDDEEAQDEAPAPEPAPAPRPAARKAAKAGTPSVPAGVIDPMQWWGALTQQFTELATNAMKEGGTEVARNLAGSMVKQGLDAASKTLGKAASVPMAVAKSAASAAQHAVTGAGKAAGKSAKATGAAASPARRSPAATAKKAAARKTAKGR